MLHAPFLGHPCCSPLVINNVCMPRFHILLSVCSSLPAAWEDMQALSVLEVNSNQLKGPLPDAWGANGSLPSLHTMNLVRPWVSENMPWSPGDWTATYSSTDSLECMRTIGNK